MANPDFKEKATTSLQTNLNRQATDKLSKARHTIATLLEEYKPQIMRALPKHLTPDRIIRVALTAASRNPELLECTPTSFLGAVIQASQLGLEVDSPLGQGYLLPFNNGKTKQKEVTFVPGYMGYVALAYRNPRIVDINANVVRKGDVFEYEYGTEKYLKHKPNSTGTGEITHAYAIAQLVGGGTVFVVMSKEEIDKIRAMSKARNSEMWASHYPEASKKTAIRRLRKLLPLSVELAKAAHLDELVEEGVPQGLDIKDIDEGGEFPIAQFNDITPGTPEQLPAQAAPVVVEQSVPAQSLPADFGEAEVRALMDRVMKLESVEKSTALVNAIQKTADEALVTDGQRKYLLDQLKAKVALLQKEAERKK